MLRLIQRWPAWRGRPPDAAPAGRSVSGSLQALTSRIASACGAPTSRLRGLAAAGLVLLAALAGLAAPAAAQTTTTEVEIWSATVTVDSATGVNESTLSRNYFYHGEQRYEISEIEFIGVYWTGSQSLGSGNDSFILYVNGTANNFTALENTVGIIVNIGLRGWNSNAGETTSFRLVEVIENTSANLSALSLRDPDGGAVVLSPAFSASTTSYTAVIPYKASTGPYYATLWATGKSLSITPVDAVTSAPGHQVQLSPGKPKTVTVAVTAGDGTTMKSYTVAVTRSATDVCERTPAVRDAIVAAVSGVTHCERLTPAHLRGINPQYGLSITSPGFRRGDFAGLSGLGSLILSPTESETLPGGLLHGLTGLRILTLFGRASSLTRLPQELFSGLVGLEEVQIIRFSNLEALPVGLFEGLSRLKILTVAINRNLASLQLGIFHDLSGLTDLLVFGNGLTTLPLGILDGLTRLRWLALSESSIESLPPRIFDDLTALDHLSLGSNNLTTLPLGIFERLTRLETIYLQGNPGSANFRPIADAGPDLRVAHGASVALAGGTGESPWGSNVTYAWTQVDASDNPVSPATVTLAGADTATPSFTEPATTGEFYFRLTVTGRGTDRVDSDENASPIYHRHSDTVRVQVVPDALANNDGGGPFYGVVTFDQVAQGFRTGSRGADFYGVDLKIALIGDAYTGPRSRPAPTVRLRRGSLTGQDVATLTGPESGITSYAWRSYSFRTASGIRLAPDTSYYVVIGSDTQKDSGIGVAKTSRGAASQYIADGWSLEDTRWVRATDRNPWREKPGPVVVKVLAGEHVAVNAPMTHEVEIWSATVTVDSATGVNESTLSRNYFYHGGQRYEISEIEFIGVYWTGSQSLGSGNDSFILYVNGTANNFTALENTVGIIVNIGLRGWNSNAGEKSSFRLVEVTDSNALPTASDRTVTTAEDTTHTFTAGDFGFSDNDSGDSLTTLSIESLPEAGLLALDGTAVTAGEGVTRADLDAGKLTFAPAPDANGTAHASFGFKVNDGIGDSWRAYRMTVDVTAVPDAATGTVTAEGRAEVGAVLHGVLSDVADVDGLPEEPSYSWQWIRVDGSTETAIPEATGGSYTLTAEDRGKPVRVKVTFQDDTGAAETLTSAATATVGAATTAAPACPAPILAGRRQVWTGDVTVADLGSGKHGYTADPLKGALSNDGRLTIHKNQMLVVEASVSVPGGTGDPHLRVGLDFDLEPGQRAALRLHVCGRAYEFAHANKSTVFGQYEWSDRHPALDWSAAVGAGKERTLHLSLPPDRQATGRPLVGVEWRGPYRGPGDEYETAAEGLFHSNIGRAYSVKEELGNVLDPGDRLWAHTHRTARQSPNTPEGIVDPDGLAPDGFTYQWIRVEMDADATLKVPVEGHPNETITLVRAEPTGREIEIPGATGRHYTLRDADDGHRIKLRVTARDVLGGGPYTLESTPQPAPSTYYVIGADPDHPPPVLPGICGRTPAVRDYILSAPLVGESDCEKVSLAHLRMLGRLELRYGELRTMGLRPGDLDGLTGLTALNFTDLTALPAGIFDQLAALRQLNLGFNDLTALPPGVFDKLTELEDLSLEDSALNVLPAGIVDKLTKLTSLTLAGNALPVLPPDVFDELTALTALELSDNDLTALPPDVFDELTALTALGLSGNDLTALPEGVFEKLTALTVLSLFGNPGTSTFVPVANAGPDQGSVSESSTVTLSGSATGPWGNNVAWSWKQVTSATDNTEITSGAVTLTGATTATPSFTMPSGSVYFELTVTARGTALTDTDTVIVSTSALATTAPSVTGVTILPEFGNGSWGEGETVEVALTFDEAVTVDTAGGVPAVSLTLGASTAKTAAYVRGSGTTELVFGYTLAKDEGPYDSVLLALNSLALNGGAIRSTASGADAALAHDGFAVIGSPVPRGVAEPGPTASFSALPERHDGESAFDIELQFSAAPDALSYKTVGGSLLAVTGGTVQKARRKTARSNIGWVVTIRPSGSGDIAIRLPARACGEANAVCFDNSPLARDATAAVPGVPVVPGVPFTASFAGAPAEHDGDTAFTVNFHLSLAPATLSSYATVRDSLFDVTGARIVKARRLTPRKNQNWELTVAPGGLADVTLRLKATTDCGSPPGVCTADGRKLSGGLAATVRGPAALSVADSEVEEAADAVLAFRVTLSRARAAATTVDYATSDGTASAGADYTAASSTLTFAAGETAKTVSVTVLDDAHDEGSETLTLTLSNPSPSAVKIADGDATGTIRNTDHMPKAWLARFGRTVAGHVLDAVAERMTAPRAAGLSATLGGQALPGMGFSGDGEDAAPTGALAAETREAEVRAKALSDWLNGGTRDDGEEARRIGSRTMSGRELALGSAFSLTGETADGGTAGFWGRAAVSGFDGREGELILDGEVTTGLLGADYGRGRWLLGLIASHSRGEGSYRGSSAGTVSSTLTGVHPWARYALSERLSVWGAAGYGQGTLTLDPEGEGAGKQAMQADLSFAMAAAGARGELLEPPGDAGGPALALVSDAMFVRTESERTRGLAAASADVTRLRLALDGSWRFVLAGDAALTPSLELGVRHDGGDAETGFGVDIGGGLAFADPKRGLTFDVSARTLVTHEESGFRERGITAALTFDPRPSTDRGLTMSLRQTLGAASTGGADALMGRETLTGLGANDNGGARRLELTAGYGIAMFGGRFTGTPEIGVGLSDTGRDYRLGWRLGLGSSGGTSFELGLEATRRESANDNADPEHTVGFRIRAIW